jgi:hypothetical protein
MEKVGQEEYRDNLAEKLREIRNSNPDAPEISQAEARGYLMAREETEEYKEAEKIHRLSSVAERLNPIVDSAIEGYSASDSAKHLFGEWGIASLQHEFSKDREIIYIDLIGTDGTRLGTSISVESWVAAGLAQHLNENKESVPIPENYTLFVRDKKGPAIRGNRIESREGVWSAVMVNP